MGVGLYFINSFYAKILGINKSEFLVHYTSKVQTARNVKISKGEGSQKAYISFATSGGCYYQGLNGIEIGTNTLWAHGCKFISTNHSFKNYSEPTEAEPIRIGSNVWLGANVVVLPGIQIGDNSVVGAGAIVTKNVLNNAIVGGNPAKLLAMRCRSCGDKISLHEYTKEFEECRLCLI
ncbi:acyltransferase [Saprospiraceae bacterium]|nr:acyltransferase [Saprospiraceae bacterium]